MQVIIRMVQSLDNARELLAKAMPLIIQDE